MTRTTTRTAMNKLNDIARYKVVRQHYEARYIIASTLAIDHAHAIAERDAWSLIGMISDAFPIMTQVWQLQDSGRWECIEQFTVGETGVIFEYLPE